jgi:hypothetical protein
MGKNKETTAETLEEILGGGGEEETSDTPETLSESETSTDEEPGQTPEEQEAAAKKETTPAAKAATQSMTEEQVEITKQIALIDADLEKLQGRQVDTGAFYDNLDEYLTEEEASLEFSDKSAYMKLVGDKLAEYTESNSNASAVKELEEKKEELQQIYKRQEGIVEVSGKYPDFDYEKMQEFFENDLSKAEQQKIIGASASYAEVYENTFKRYQEVNPSAIAQVEPPHIPDPAALRTQTLKPGSIDVNLMDEDEGLKDALGI